MEGDGPNRYFGEEIAKGPSALLLVFRADFLLWIDRWTDGEERRGGEDMSYENE